MPRPPSTPDRSRDDRRGGRDRSEPGAPGGPADALERAGLAPVARVAGADLVVRVVVQPGARRPAVVGRHGDELRLRVAAPPERGRANAEVVRVVAEALGVAAGDVEVARGRSGRHKELVVRDGARAEVVRRLAIALEGGSSPG